MTYEEWQSFYVVVRLMEGEVCGINAFESLDDAKELIDEWTDDWLGDVAEGNPPKDEVVIREVKLTPKGLAMAFDTMCEALPDLEESELDYIAKHAAGLRDQKQREVAESDE